MQKSILKRICLLLDLNVTHYSRPLNYCPYPCLYISEILRLVHKNLIILKPLNLLIHNIIPEILFYLLRSWFTFFQKRVSPINQSIIKLSWEVFDVLPYSSSVTNIEKKFSVRSNYISLLHIKQLKHQKELKETFKLFKETFKVLFLFEVVIAIKILTKSSSA